MMWKLIDVSKLKEGLHSFVTGIQKMRNDDHKKKLNAIGISGHSTLQLKADVSHSYFHILSQYRISLEMRSFTSVL
jgi:hypothetical protein